jgi:hypothetical protein
MKTTLLVLIAALPLAARDRKEVDLRAVAEPASRKTVTLRYSERYRAAVKDPRIRTADELPQAPGVVQFNLFDEAQTTWFVATSRIPAGATISPYLILSNDFEFPLQPLRLTEDILPGDSLTLPHFRRYSSFWPAGVITYEVVVTVDGTDYHAIGDHTVLDAARNYEDTQTVIPLIHSSAQTGEAGRFLSMRGVFTSDQPRLVLTDITVPPDAIVSASASEIIVDLTKVPDFDLGILSEYLLTIGQSGWCDTAVFRYVPMR